jgi:hypothetical protein
MHLDLRAKEVLSVSDELALALVVVPGVLIKALDLEEPLL